MLVDGPLSSACHLMMHKSTVVAVLLGFWNKPPSLYTEIDKLHCKTRALITSWSKVVY